jgi:hypothetical protein
LSQSRLRAGKATGGRDNAQAIKDFSGKRQNEFIFQSKKDMESEKQGQAHAKIALPVPVFRTSCFAIPEKTDFLHWSQF